MIVLGIDPGSRVTGFGVVERRDGVLRHVRHGTVVAGRGAELAPRLVVLRRGLLEVLDGLRPDAVAVEGMFHARNTRSALVLAQARGVILEAVVGRGLPLGEYSPAEVKRAVVGSGRATKDQVGGMVRRLLALAEAPPPDAADALALAICHLHAAPLAVLRTRRGAGRAGR